MSNEKIHDRPHRPIRWRRAIGGPGYYAEIKEGGLLVCTLAVVKRRLPFHRRSGIVVVDRWTCSILEMPDGRARLDVAGGAFTSAAAAKAHVVQELERIRAATAARTYVSARLAGRT